MNELLDAGVDGEAEEINKKKNNLKAAMMVAALLRMLNMID